MNDNYFNVTIGRRIGSGGLTIARKLGKMLGVEVYDKELIMTAAKDYGIGAEFFEKADEKGPDSFNDSAIGSNNLFKLQTEVIRRLAGMQSNVFVGRCADYVLRDYPKLVTIFVSAPLEARKATVADRFGISEEKAETYIRKMERKRKSYYEYFTFRDWGSSENYDLCIDSSILGSDMTASLISDFVKMAIS
ncbi:MAG: cytidylate kinase-like family protein [Bacteroidales bacterium]|jgi:cytidylate kinase|nr:cytidylate kinase-like family protein [Bacteroidales bacterium]MCI2122322.1 cytidylate kinase-like family protein [Bacteroidales bacterium]MCI2145352.1 cytidylate kinase-like family protein [Bacteroidales bacterium]